MFFRKSDHASFEAEQKFTKYYEMTVIFFKKAIDKCVVNEYNIVIALYIRFTKALQKPNERRGHHG